MRKLLLATNNQGKVFEFNALLRSLDIDIQTPASLGLVLEIDENADTYAENASHKAKAFGQATGLVSLADDSGLEVEVLGGLPGIHSHRFSPKAGATDGDRRKYLLSQIKGYPRPWAARFHCSVAIYQPEGGLFLSEGKCVGEIIPEERGTNGFGYDPIFYIPEYGLTMAELSLEQKNRISHRALAVMAARDALKSIFDLAE